ncbi:ABC transporter ATP-binding protein [Streptosporangium pseudovulgare]|uniref:ABC transporter ATP-binding protein n=1 Tax=Streptosporangium pseudovulgare TaxID=35765 RepID=A0ABQ2RAI3_9ACTN|nr:ABC transporter ATP-binding protein [Streptosporangium pseudovulgare]GGQ17996.1 ABC transporter ATP-binding protein [Streptosporangium pseudovulgare]
MSAVVSLERVRKTYGEVTALDHVSLDFPRGRFVAVMGPSGSGKTTLLQCAAGLEPPDSGQVLIGGADVTRLSETKRTELRRKHIGFVFQSYNLLPTVSIEDNITLPLRLAGRRPDRAWLDELVGRMGLRERLRHRPAELSGGQQQRAAIVRALVARPDVVFADEPTGALDLRNAIRVLDVLRGLVDELGQTVVMVTHDPAAAARAHDTLVMADGKVIDTLAAPTADELAVRLAHLAAEPVA